MPFDLMQLPFETAALEPHMSAETLDYHHGKHHRAYVDKVNGWPESAAVAGKSLIEIIRQAKQAGNMPLFDNAAQIWNHNFFWNCLAPESAPPSGKLAEMIATTFGSADNLLERLGAEAVSHFGSGWAWLVMDRDQLIITTLHDADTPVVHDFQPLLTLDVWEHAYYVDYRNARPKFIAETLRNIVSWDFVAHNLDGEGVSRGDQTQA
jgi:Fe-Mn family superoxide dismutase